MQFNIELILLVEAIKPRQARINLSGVIKETILFCILSTCYQKITWLLYMPIHSVIKYDKTQYIQLKKYMICTYSTRSRKCCDDIFFMDNLNSYQDHHSKNNHPKHYFLQL